MRTGGSFVLLLVVGVLCAMAALVAQETATAGASSASALPQASATKPPVFSPQEALNAPVTEQSPALPAAMPAGLIARMNDARGAAGLPPLARDVRLDAVAAARAEDLLAGGYFAHFGPSGQSAFTELGARGITYGLAGENLARNNYAAGSESLEVAFDGLMASPTHRANILEERFASVGAAVVRGDDGMWIYVTVFVN
ncbi:MAG TPA: CAP domain-containing protein [Tepidiformaceae bacterium]